MTIKVLNYLGLILLIGSIFVIASHPVEAATFDVSTGSELQTALTTAASNNQDDTINLSAGTYQPTASGAFQFNSPDGDDLTLVGAGQDNTTITNVDGGGINILTTGGVNFSNITIDTTTEYGLNIESNGGTSSDAFNITVTNATFSNNNNGYGLSVYNSGSVTAGTITVSNSTFDNNQNSGINLVNLIGEMEVIVNNNTVTNNSASGMIVELDSSNGSSAVIKNNWVDNNTGDDGAGIRLFDRCLCAVSVINNVLTNNTSGGNGGGIYVEFWDGGDGAGDTLMTFLNNTIANNSSTSNGGGIYTRFILDNARYNYFNNIFWNNSTSGDGDDVTFRLDSWGSVYLSNNDLDEFCYQTLEPIACANPESGLFTNFTAENNINEDPLFVGGTGATAYKLSTGSPAIGSGTASAPGMPEDDYSGDAYNSPPNMGAFTTVTTPSQNTSSGQTSSSLSSGPARCSDSAPSGIPNLFRIDTAGSYVNLYFSTVAGGTGYNVNYGLTPEANQYGDNFGYSGDLWNIGRTVSGLSPNTTYYFRVQAVNGCNAGGWSAVKSVKTKGQFANVTQWFANLSPFNSGPAIITSKPSAQAVAGVSKTPGSCSYTVKQGDSFWRIASEQLGSGARFREIQGLNPGISVLRIGQTISVCK